MGQDRKNGSEKPDLSENGNKRRDNSKTESEDIRMKNAVNTARSERVAQAEAAITKMQEDYPNWAVEDVLRLEQYLRDAVPADGTGKLSYPDAFKIVHDMRGQGGSFGYPLITRVAGSFCKFMELANPMTPQALTICAAHAKAMRTILEKRVTGHGGELGDKIASGLENAADKYLENQ